MTSEKHTRRSFLIVLLLAFGLLGVAGRVEAVPLSEFTGNTFVDSGLVNEVLGVSGTINYAVLPGSDVSGISSSFMYGAGSPTTLDTSGYVYLFQVANNGFNSNVPISQLSVGINGLTPTSWGYFTQTVFVDSEGVVNASNNLGPVDPASPGGRPALGSDHRVGVTSVGFSALTTAMDPTTVQMNLGIDVQHFFIAPEVGAGQTSSLLVFTSSALPTWLSADVSNLGSVATGPVPGPIDSFDTVPEPGTLLLLGSGLIGLAARPLWRRRPEGWKKGEG